MGKARKDRREKMWEKNIKN
jgi:hypothetical protein